jgi:hypothetical protein
VANPFRLTGLPFRNVSVDLNDFAGGVTAPHHMEKHRHLERQWNLEKGARMAKLSRRDASRSILHEQPKARRVRR